MNVNRSLLDVGARAATGVGQLLSAEDVSRSLGQCPKQAKLGRRQRQFAVFNGRTMGLTVDPESVADDLTGA